MKLLAFDTSTQACSVAVNINGDIVEQFQLIPREHAKQVLPMIESGLQQAGLALAELDAIAYGNGPGSFTGLRIAASIAQGLAFGVDIPVIPISSLAAIARGVSRLEGHSRCLVVLDAHMQEFYWAGYQFDGGDIQVVESEQLAAPGQISIPTSWAGQAWVGAGDGWRQQDVMPGGAEQLLADSYPHACDIAALAEAAWQQGLVLPAEQAIPTYLRDKTAWKTKHQR